MKTQKRTGHRRLWMLGAAATLGMLVSLAAWALPYPAYGYTTLATYYSTAAKTEVVGLRAYENCPPGSPPFLDRGVTSAHVTVEIIRCPFWGGDPEPEL
ncbi:hypothetical protein [Lysobacter sp. Root983]|uniref:hypothetical protein n=1 Tax=Lysobacter sp. Root983 TaxID=1736613 RepID=UPI0007093701|nr:hypothetical protein [Lysobacter sp. Root983]KRD75953.1 hypothetical protein ASE43_14090 [Lysobacter sp. Root983]